MRYKISNKGFYIITIIIAAIIYFITAYNSNGFYHADEHYQLIEFARLKTGENSTADLPWEYKTQMRSAFQPTICYGIFKTLLAFNIKDPYSQAFALRLITAILAILIINFFIKQTENQFKNDNIKRAYYLLSWFLWFIPFISVRFSSETWSGLLFLLSLAVFINPKEYLIKPYIIGLLFGFSFLIRFQSAFLIIGLILWFIFIKRLRFSYLLKIFIAFACIFCLGILIDRWFYNEWTLTSYNYLYTTILEDGASGFGRLPWYFYLQKLIWLPGYFIGIPLAGSIIMLLIKSPKNIFLWSIVPFIIVHSIIPHKEDRFLFPIVYLFPIILVSAYELAICILKNNIIIRILSFLLIVIFVIINGVGLIAMAQKSAGIGRMEITKYIHENFKGKKTNLIYSTWANPYNPWQSLPMKFYLEQNMSTTHIENLNELNDSLFIDNTENFLVIRKAELGDAQHEEIISSFGFKYEKQSIPIWIERLNQNYHGFENYNIIILYRLQK
jgi:GPI mannosyltransferase 3